MKWSLEASQTKKCLVSECGIMGAREGIHRYWMGSKEGS